MAYINIGGELNPKTMAKKVAKAEYVYDPNQGGKKQSEINADLYDKIAHIQPGTEQIQSDWNQTDTEAKDFIKNKPAIPTVPTDVSAFTNDAGYLVPEDIVGKVDSEDLANVATSGSYNDLVDKPDFATNDEIRNLFN